MTPVLMVTAPEAVTSPVGDVPGQALAAVLADAGYEIFHLSLDLAAETGREANGGPEG